MPRYIATKFKDSRRPTDPTLMATDVARAQRQLERARRRALRPAAETPLPPDAQPGRTHPATRAALLNACLDGLGQLALAAGMVAAAILLAHGDPRRYDDLLRHGTRTTGIVRSAHQHGYRLGVFFLRVRVEYPAAGALHSTTVWLDTDAKRYRRGQPVPVVYRTGRPAVATVVGEWNVPWWRRMAEWFMGILAIIPLVAGLTVWPGLWRTWRALRRRPWIASEYSIDVGGRYSSPTVYLIAGSSLSPTLKIRATRRRLSPFRVRPPDVVWVATGGDGRPVAVATPGPGRVYPVRSRRRAS
jgi:hypothetical protein